MPPVPPRVGGRGADGGGASPGGSASLPPYSFQGAFQIGFESFQKHYVTLLLVSLVYAAIAIIGVFVQLALDAVAAPLGSLMSIPYAFLVTMPFVVAMLIPGVRAARGQKPAVEDLMLVIPRYWGTVGYGVLIYLAMLVVVIPVSIVAGVVGVAAGANRGGGSGALVAAFLFIIVMSFLFTLVATTFLSARLYPGLLRLVDPELPRIGVFDAMKYSSSRTAGLVWLSLAGLLLTVATLSALSCCLLIVGVIFLGLPLFISVMGAAYAMLSQASLRGFCPNCGYDIRSTPGMPCPECGAVQGGGGVAPAM